MPRLQVCSGKRSCGLTVLTINHQPTTNNQQPTANNSLGRKPHVKNNKQMNFQAEVIKKSYHKPVVVDFWAEWCGPCKMLGPIIESLAEEQADQWELVKVNTEEEYELAARYGIRSIPNVKMFYQGEVVAEFAGALPRASILRWLEEHLPDSRLGGLEAVLQRLTDGGPADELEAFVAQNPDVAEARLALAQVKLVASPAEALRLIEDIRLGHKLEETAEALRTIAELLQLPADEAPAASLLAQARTAWQQQEDEAAIKAVIDAVTVDKHYQNDLPRRLAIAFFHLWGPAHPLTKDYRWRFDMALY